MTPGDGSATAINKGETAKADTTSYVWYMQRVMEWVGHYWYILDSDIGFCNVIGG